MYFPLGFGSIKINEGGNTDSHTDFAYGLGATIHFNDHIAANMEWTQYYKGEGGRLYANDNVKVDGMSFGLQFRF